MKKFKIAKIKIYDSNDIVIVSSNVYYLTLYKLELYIINKILPLESDGFFIYGDLIDNHLYCSFSVCNDLRFDYSRYSFV